ncbi:hypothetical protein C8Q75DRAFT_802800 [Abortiporus biennis]|nr:hypothetical protein C8Q75DRAFT_802800 [Abortiporus biennis]
MLSRHSPFLLFLFAATTCAAGDQVPLTQEPYPNLGVSSDEWAALNVSVGGRLLTGKPFSQACFTDPNSEACHEVRQHYRDGTLRYSFPGGLTATQWETCQVTGHQCLLNHTDPHDPQATAAPYACLMGSISPHYIDVRSAQDVINALSFSKRTGVPIVIKNTGHDYMGRSAAPGSLGLWTHNMNSMTFIRDFVPAGCETSPKPAIKMQAGVQWGQAYLFAHQHNVTLVGGSDKGVGAVGGWLMGGGHGLLSNTMGLGVDRVLEFTVVTPDGVLRTANACENKDLFFALRGGGGGTFGIVIDATVTASPPVKLQTTLVKWDTYNLELTFELMKILVENAESIAKNGFGLTIFPSAAIFTTPTLTSKQAADVMAPILTFGNSLSAREIPGALALSLELDGWYPFFKTLIEPYEMENGVNFAGSSRLVPHSSFATEKSQSELYDALVDMISTTGFVTILGTTPVNFPYESGSTSVTDAWRDAVWHVTTAGTWGFNASLEEKRDHYAKISRAIDRLRAITPPGAYGNEADLYEPDHEVSFWGSHYEKLLRIKSLYDPDHLLDCWRCVGWRRDSQRFSCYLPEMTNDTSTISPNSQNSWAHLDL